MDATKQDHDIGRRGTREYLKHLRRHSTTAAPAGVRHKTADDPCLGLKIGWVLIQESNEFRPAPTGPGWVELTGNDRFTDYHDKAL
jgi:hypothetical protein